MSDTRAPSAPTTGVDEEEASKAELVRALNETADRVLRDPMRVAAIIGAAVAAQIPPPAPHRCTRPHVDEIQTWNPAYKQGTGPLN